MISRDFISETEYILHMRVKKTEERKGNKNTQYRQTDQIPGGREFRGVGNNLRGSGIF